MEATRLPAQAEIKSEIGRTGVKVAPPGVGYWGVIGVPLSAGPAKARWDGTVSLQSIDFEMVDVEYLVQVYVRMQADSGSGSVGGGGGVVVDGEAWKTVAATQPTQPVHTCQVRKEGRGVRREKSAQE